MTAHWEGRGQTNLPFGILDTVQTSRTLYWAKDLGRGLIGPTRVAEGFHCLNAGPTEVRCDRRAKQIGVCEVMRSAFVGLIMLLPAASFASPEAPIRWAPDGRWMAYTLAIPDARPPVGPGWLYGSTGGTGNDEPSVDAPIDRYRIYAANALTGASVLLESSPEPLSSPAWHPNAQSIAFVRVVKPSDGPARQEVVVQGGSREQCVLLSRPVEGGAVSGEVLAGFVPAWSPDGRYLAVPTLGRSLDLCVIRADNGRILQTVPGGSRPAWSPDGSKLAFLRTNAASTPRPSTTLQVMETTFGPARQVANLGRVEDTPVWARDGRSLLAVFRRTSPRGRRGSVQQVDLVSVTLENGANQVVSNYANEPAEKESLFRGLCSTIDREGDELFYSLDVEGQLGLIVWFRPKLTETVNRFNPLDTSVRIGGLALSPDGRTLAIRFGSDAEGGPAALLDLASNRVDLVVPDLASRLNWLGLLVKTGRDLVRLGSPPPMVNGKGVLRPTVLPVPGEFPRNQEFSLRLRRLGRLGRPLCDVPAGSAAPTPAEERFLREARLFFDVLRDDGPSALASLDALDAETESPDERLRLLNVRAQVLISTGDFERAGDTIAYLKGRSKQAPPSLLESTPAGFVLTEEESGPGWAEYLSRRLGERIRPRSEGPKRSQEGSVPDFPTPARLGLMPDAGFVPPAELPPHQGGDVRDQMRANFRRRREEQDAFIPVPDGPPQPRRR